MKKHVFRADGNKMIFESGFKTFDDQTLLIDRGNVVAPTQISSFVRAANDTSMFGGESCDEGHLQMFDLRQFIDSHLLGTDVKRYYKRDEYPKTHETILYVFLHVSDVTRVIDGWVITDTAHHVLSKWCRDSEESRMAVDECLKYIVEEGSDE